jgi:hypothetical protein
MEYSVRTGGGVLWLIFWALVVIFFEGTGTRMLQTENMYPVACELSGLLGKRQCAYSLMLPFEIRANLSSDEVLVVYNGDPAFAYRYSRCTILDAKNYSCQRDQWPFSTETYDSKSTTRDGRHLKSSGSKMVCYPNQIVRWIIKWGVLSTSFDTSSLVRWLLNCDGAD